MKKNIPGAMILACLLTGCVFPGRRNVDWRKAWTENEHKLQQLKTAILKDGGKKYLRGNYEFPPGFDYPFDDGFYIERSVDSSIVTITFYTDRGVMDHYSAIVFTNDTSMIDGLDQNIGNGGNDFRIGQHWYMIND